jgi:GIY-YIG domain-containing protein
MKDNFVGPCRAGREGIKTKLFQYFQQRGFTMFYRWMQCVPPEEPADVEELLLMSFDYAGNERSNRGYRQVKLQGGKNLRDLGKGCYL